MQLKFSFNKEKSLDVVLYIAHRLKRTDFHKIFKILYFSDRLYIAEYGRPITGDVYIAMDDGPVPSKIYDIFKMVRGDSYSPDTEGFGELFSVEDWQYFRPKKHPNESNISVNEKAVIDRCLLQYGDLSFDEVREKSHDIAWRSTAKNYMIDIENIAREAGLEDEDIGYIDELNRLQNAIL